MVYIFRKVMTMTRPKVITSDIGLYIMTADKTTSHHMRYLFKDITNDTTPGVAPGIFHRGTDSSDEGAKITFSGYYKCQKSPKKITFHLPTGG